MTQTPLTQAEIDELAKLGFQMPLNAPGAEAKARMLLAAAKSPRIEKVPEISGRVQKNPTRAGVGQTLLIWVLGLAVLPFGIVASIVAAIMICLYAVALMIQGVWRILMTKSRLTGPPA